MAALLAVLSSCPSDRAASWLRRTWLCAAAARLRSGELSAEAYARALLGLAEGAQEVNAFVGLDADAVLGAARAADARRARGERPGALHGVPLTFKDNIDVAGSVTTAGTPLLSIRARQSAAVAQALVEAGAGPTCTSWRRA
jgi:Asp-tRNA(Asn)/Glu-tRNA(Gln) amidotransferase A subunit family amidase